MIAGNPARSSSAVTAARRRAPARAAAGARAGTQRRPQRESRRQAARARADLVRPGPTVVMGLAWAALLLAGAETGPEGMAAVVLPVAVVAAVSSVREVNRDGRISDRRASAIAVASAVLLPLAGLGGPIAAAVVGLLVASGAVTVLVLTVGRPVPYRMLAAALGPSVAAASVVVARGQGLSEGLTLVAAICFYDMASFLTGTGPRGGPIGALVGIVTVAVLAVFVAAVVVPPFSGHSPWILLGLVAALAPAGVFALGRVGPHRRLPALRRLDAFVLAGPAWVIAVRVVLH